ncbi:hypothetical protein TWF281_009112 [Arthrobotrys megalospora]
MPQNSTSNPELERAKSRRKGGICDLQKIPKSNQSNNFDHLSQESLRTFESDSTLCDEPGENTDESNDTSTSPGSTTNRRASSAMLSHWLRQPKADEPYSGLGNWDLNRRKF